MNNIIPDDMKKVIKEMYFPKSTDNEFMAFLFDANAKGLDPLQKEILPITFKGRTSTVVSRDGYVRKAKENPSFLGYNSQAIYSNDIFEYTEEEGGFEYKFQMTNLNDRGDLVGAFCHVKMKDPVEDSFAMVTYKESRQRTPVWNTHPALMTQKVAEVRALKPITQLSGVCSDVELGQNVTNDETVMDVEMEELESTAEKKSQDSLFDFEEPTQPEEEHKQAEPVPDFQSVPEISEYFQNKSKGEGITVTEMKSDVSKFHRQKKINDELYKQVWTWLKQEDGTTLFYKEDKQ